MFFLQDRDQGGCENIHTQSVGSKVFFESVFRELPLIDHATCIIDQDIEGMFLLEIFNKFPD